METRSLGYLSAALWLLACGLALTLAFDLPTASVVPEVRLVPASIAPVAVKLVAATAPAVTGPASWRHTVPSLGVLGHGD